MQTKSTRLRFRPISGDGPAGCAWARGTSVERGPPMRGRLPRKPPGLGVIGRSDTNPRSCGAPVRM